MTLVSHSSVSAGDGTRRFSQTAAGCGNTEAQKGVDSHTMRTVLVISIGLTAGAALLSACDSKNDAQPVAAASSPKSVASGVAAPAASSSSASTKPASGPVVSIPAGTLVAGSKCGDHPRLPNVELPGTKIEMTAFDIDRFPYPNEPNTPPKTGATRDEAQKLCQARGRRLCTELEWERACKGPKNTKYEYGNRFDSKKCPSPVGKGAEDKAFPQCKSAFGVEAMHARHWEWTASDWGREGQEGLVTLRGSEGGTPYAAMRCANVKAVKPDTSDPAIGFRCCGGPANKANVSLPVPETPLTPVEPISPIEDALAARFGNALRNGGSKAQDDVTYTFTRAWRWRPVNNEEMFIVERKASPAQGAPSFGAYVIQLCTNRALLRSQLLAPIDSLEDPKQRDDGLSLAVKAGDESGDVIYRYQFGQVHTTQPGWLKPASPSP